MTPAANPADESPTGLNMLPPNFTQADLDAVPVLESLDDLVIEGLTDEEYLRFIAAINE